MTEDEKSGQQPTWVSPTEVRNAHAEAVGVAQPSIPATTVASTLASAAVSAATDDNDDDDLDDDAGWAPTSVLGWGILLGCLLAVFLLGRLFSC